MFWFAVGIFYLLILLALSKAVRHKLDAVSNLLLCLVASGAFFILGECFFRTRHYLVRKIPPFAVLENYSGGTKNANNTNRQLFTGLGWQGKEIRGDKNSPRKKMLVVGDSFTDGMGLAEDALYYSHLAKSLNTELFVYAAKGYSSLQEYLAIDHMLEIVKPDLILLQVCSNDLINNYYPLEKQSHSQRFPMKRPYLESGQIVYRFAGRFETLHLKLGQHSRFFHFLSSKLDHLSLRLHQLQNHPGIEKRIAQEGKSLPQFREAIAVTEQIVELIKKRVSKTPIIAFIADTPRVERIAFRQIFSKHKIGFVESAAVEVEKLKQLGEVVTIADGTHWNARGHLVISNTLESELRNAIN